MIRPNDRPWLAQYAPSSRRILRPSHRALAMFRAAVERAPDATAVTYFDGRLTVRDVDELSDALAQALLAEASPRATGGLSICRISALRPRLGHAQTIREWCRLTTDDVVLGVAPLFHITGLIAHVAVALLGPAELVLFYGATRT